MKNVLNLCLCALLLAGAVSCTKERVEPAGPGDNDINRKVDKYLAEYYLWNAEYKTTPRDFTLAYDQFLQRTLLGMTSNTLDRKLRNGKFQLYSYIEQTGQTRATADTRGVNHGVKKSAVFSFGIASMASVQYVDGNNLPTGEYALAVSGVYTGSAAEKAGVKRGLIISKVNGAALTQSNITSYYKTLTAPGKATTVTLVERGADAKTYTLASSELFENPVLYSQVISTGGRRIGYLVYSGFDAAYDDEVLAQLKEFRTAGITDLVLDLRINGGGHVVSAQMIASCVAGALSSGKVFEYYRYNDSRMANPSATSIQTGYPYDQAAGRFYANFKYGDYYGVDLKQYALGVGRLYVLTTGSTASASELVINSLRGIDFPVTLIGAKTNGKNVGMEPTDLTDRGHKYKLVPITFQSYNAKNATVDPDGIPVDSEVRDFNGGYVDFGEPTEPLLAQAVSMITGQGSPALALAAGGPGLRIAEGIELPEVPHRPQGMILLPGDGE